MTERTLSKGVGVRGGLCMATFDRRWKLVVKVVQTVVMVVTSSHLEASCALREQVVLRKLSDVQVP